MFVFIWFYTLKYFRTCKNGTKPTKNQQGLPISKHVNFGFTGSSKPVEVLQERLLLLLCNTSYLRNSLINNLAFLYYLLFIAL